MTIPVVLVGENTIQLWNLSSQQRLQRQIKQAPGLTLAENGRQGGKGKQLNVCTNFLFDSTTLTELADHDESVLVDPVSGQVAAVVSTVLTAPEQQALLDRPYAANQSLQVLTPADLAVYNDKLRRHTAPTLAALDPAQQAQLEAKLYGASYKGITDLVTKWWWPRPAKQGVHLCAALGITPNQVTLFGAILMLLAIWLFAEGQFAAGLAAGWFMTYLDTVDGKLARVTVQSSKIGHVLDHGMDIVHPPFWYMAWGVGLNAAAPLLSYVTLYELNVLMLAGYLAGRAIEGAFHALGTCGLFSWRPFDAYFRLITGRRNPCLILLTLGWAMGRPDLGLLWVVAWTVLSSAILLARLLYAALVRLRSGPLHSWLADGEQAAAQYPKAHRTFASTRVAYEVRSANE